ncbi:Gfo/Idh/MocA family protein [Nocardioides sp. B-3]|uniref:Gfo/Idh/MocA family protein n=1 Tax=Nocardioides sp. B-3 TaxID=2895565 RepID=UPI002152AE3F|nr:Gfo/Idh/MocA family oxidoreductase [Nocardioides sp. B-3]
MPSRPGAGGIEQVTVDDAARATLGTRRGAVASIEVSRMAFGRKNGLTIEVYGSHGSISFDPERLNELVVDTGSGGARTLVTEADHPYAGARWPPGHVLGWDHTFTSQAADFPAAVRSSTQPSPSFAEGLAVQRVLGAIADSASADGTRVEVTAH